MRTTHRKNAGFWATFVIANLVLVLLFTLVRMPLMNTQNYEVRPKRRLRRFTDSLYISVMHQSTVGDSTLTPKSQGAVWTSIVQTFTVFLVYGLAIAVLMGVEELPSI